MLKQLKELTAFDSLFKQSIWLGLLIWLGFFWTKLFGISDMGWILTITGFVWMPALAFIVIFVLYVIFITAMSIIERSIDND